MCSKKIQCTLGLKWIFIDIFSIEIFFFFIASIYVSNFFSSALEEIFDFMFSRVGLFFVPIQTRIFFFQHPGGLQPQAGKREVTFTVYRWIGFSGMVFKKESRREKENIARLLIASVLIRETLPARQVSHSEQFSVVSFHETCTNLCLVPPTTLSATFILSCFHVCSIFCHLFTFAQGYGSIEISLSIALPPILIVLPFCFNSSSSLLLCDLFFIAFLDAFLLFFLFFFSFPIFLLSLVPTFLNLSPSSFPPLFSSPTCITILFLHFISLPHSVCSIKFFPFFFFNTLLRIEPTTYPSS